MLKDIFSTLGATSKTILAIAGFIGLVYAVFNFPNTLTNTAANLFKEQIQFGAFVRPTCEPIASLNLKHRDGTSADTRLLGLNIETINDVSSITFRISGPIYINSWAIRSDALSEKQQKEIISSLPVGNIKEDYIFGHIDRLIANSKTIIQLQGATRTSFGCQTDWYDVSAPNQKIAVLEYDDFHKIKGMGISGNNFSFYKWFSFLLLIIIIAMTARNHTRKTTKERFRIKKK